MPENSPKAYFTGWTFWFLGKITEFWKVIRATSLKILFFANMAEFREIFQQQQQKIRQKSTKCFNKTKKKTGFFFNKINRI